MGEKEALRLSPPIQSEDLSELRIGDKVQITGVIFTARDAAHKRIVAALDAGETLPFDIRGRSSTMPVRPPHGRDIR